MIYLIIGTILAFGGLSLIFVGFRTLGVAVFVVGFFLANKGRKTSDSSEKSESNENRISGIIKIDASTKAHEIMRDYPELTDFLIEKGICGCNDGHESDLAWPMSKIAGEKGLDLPQLLEELNNRSNKGHQ